MVKWVDLMFNVLTTIEKKTTQKNLREETQ